MADFYIRIQFDQYVSDEEGASYHFFTFSFWNFEKERKFDGVFLVLLSCSWECKVRYCVLSVVCFGDLRLCYLVCHLYHFANKRTALRMPLPTIIGKTCSSRTCCVRVAKRTQWGTQWWRYCVRNEHRKIQANGSYVVSAQLAPGVLNRWPVLPHFYRCFGFSLMFQLRL